MGVSRSIYWSQGDASGGDNKQKSKPAFKVAKKSSALEFSKAAETYVKFLKQTADGTAGTVYDKRNAALSAAPPEFKAFCEVYAKGSDPQAILDVLGKEADLLNKAYGNYLLLAGLHTDTKTLQNDKYVKEMVDRYNGIADKIRSGSLTSLEVTQESAYILLIAARQSANLSPENRSIAFSAHTPEEIFNTYGDALAQEILKAGVDAIETSKPAYLDEGHAVRMEGQPARNVSLSPLYLENGYSHAPRKYAKHFVLPLWDINELMCDDDRMNDEVKGISKMGLVKRMITEMCKNSSLTPTEQKAVENIDFKKLESMLLFNPGMNTGESFLISAMNRLLKNFDKDEMNRVLANLGTRIGFCYLQVLVQSAQGTKDNVWLDKAGAGNFQKLLSDPQNVRGAMVSLVGTASEEKTSRDLEGDAKKDRRVDHECQQTADNDILYIAYGVQTPSNWKNVKFKSGDNEYEVLAPPELEGYILQGRISARSRTTHMYNLKPGETPFPNDDFKSINEVVDYLVTNNIATIEELKRMKLVGEKGEGRPITRIASKTENGTKDFYYSEDEDKFNKYVSERGEKDGRTDNVMTKYLMAQRGIQLSTVLFEMDKLSVSEGEKGEVNASPSKKVSGPQSVTYNVMNYVSPLWDKASGSMRWGKENNVTNGQHYNCIGAFYDANGKMIGSQFPGLNGKFDVPLKDMPNPGGKNLKLNSDITAKADRTDQFKIDAVKPPVHAEYNTFEYWLITKEPTPVWFFAKSIHLTPNGGVLASTGNGMTHMPKFASGLLDYDASLKLKMDFIQKMRVGVARIGMQGVINPRGYSKNIEQNEVPNVHPNPQFVKADGQWRIIYDDTEGLQPRYVFCFENNKPEFKVGCYVKGPKSGGTANEYDNQRIPIKGVPIYKCSVGESGETNGIPNISLMPITHVSADLLSKDNHAPNPSASPKELRIDPESGKKNAKTGDMVYKIYMDTGSEKLELGRATNTSEGWKYTLNGVGFLDEVHIESLKDYVYTSPTDEHGVVLRTGQGPDGKPIYGTVEWQTAPHSVICLAFPKFGENYKKLNQELQIANSTFYLLEKGILNPDTNQKLDAVRRPDGRLDLNYKGQTIFIYNPDPKVPQERQYEILIAPDNPLWNELIEATEIGALDGPGMRNYEHLNYVIPLDLLKDLT